MALTARWTRVHSVVLAFLMVTALLVAPPHERALAIDRFVDNSVGSGCVDAPASPLYCTVEFAVGDANAGDVIRIAPGMYSENSFTIGVNLTLTGQGARSNGVIISAAATGTPLVTVPGGVTASLQNLTLTGASGASVGGAVINFGNTDLVRVTITGNSAVNNGAAVSNQAGQTRVLSSLVVNNSAASTGSAFQNVGGANLVISNSTIANNSSTTVGSAINNNSGATMQINNATIVGNSGFNSVLAGGPGITVSNTILANNTPNDCNGSAVTSAGHNLIENINTCTAIGTDITGVDPNLSTLANNGGQTDSYLPLAGSQAIDNGAAIGAPPGCFTTDQVGTTRPQGAACDIGSIEVISSTPLQDLIDANPGTVIVVPPGTYTETITIGGGTTLQGGGATPADVIIDAQGAGRAVTLTAGDASFENLTITGGASPNQGGGIAVDGAGHTVNLTNVVVDNNDSTLDGAGIWVDTGNTINIVDSTLSNNVSQADGGAIYSNGATVNLTNSFLSNNRANAGGSPSLDQVSSVPANTTTVGCGGLVGDSLFQEFVPSAPVLSEVQLRLRAGGSATGQAVSIRVRDGSPTGAVLATANNSIASGADGFIPFVLGAPIVLVPNDTYVIEFLTPGDSIATWYRSSGNPYPAGDSYTACSGVLGGANTVADFEFQTFAGASASGAGFYANGGAFNLDTTGVDGNIAQGDGGGARLVNGADLQAVDSWFTANTATGAGGGLSFLSSTGVINRSLIALNTAAIGGGVDVDGDGDATSGVNEVALRNSTVSGNAGGGVVTSGVPETGGADLADVRLYFVTVTENTGAGGVKSGAANTVTLARSLVAGNTDTVGDRDCEGTIGMAAFNLIGVADGVCDLVAVGTGDQVGSPGAEIDPLLGPLANNGGATLTHELLVGSPAIDGAGTPAQACLTEDQRGVARPQGSFCDIGAFEADNVVGPLQTIINNTPDNGVALAPAGTYNESITLGRGVTLQGDGAGETIISGDGESTVVVVDGPAAIRDLSVTGGGIGIDVFTEVAEDVLIDSVQVEENNSAGIAVFDQPSVRIVNSTIGPNNGSGIVAVSDHGDGYAVEVINSTISGNNGSGFYADAGSFVGPKYLLDHVTITNNAGGSFEAGVVVEDTDNVELYLRNSIVAANSPNDCDTQVEDIISLGRNVIGENNFCGTWLSTDLVGPVGIDEMPIDPRLGPLADNGGSTLTHALLPGSPAIDHAFKSSGFTNFNGTPNVTTNGSAVVGDGVLRLTNAEWQAGSAYWQQPLLLDGEGFSTTFTFRITPSLTSASGDGLAFVIAPSTATLGDVGGRLGVATTPGPLGTVSVEFDTYANGGDVSDNHIGINIGGIGDGQRVVSDVQTDVPGAFDDGGVWTATVTYDGSTLSAEVTNGIVTENVSAPVDLTAVVGGGDPTAPVYVGFASGTAVAYATHEVLNWAGTIQGQCPATDQRGLARPAGPACDAGAFEAASIIPTELTVAIAAAGSLAVGSPVIPIEDLNVGTFFGVPTGPSASQLGAIQLGAIQLGAIQLGAIGSDLSTPFGYLSIQAIIDAAAELSAVPTILDQITLVDLPVVGGWDQYIPTDPALSPLAGRPDYTITLQQAIDDPVLGPILPTLRLADSGVSASQLGAIQLGAIQLGAIQLGAIQLGAIQLGAIEAQLQEVCQPAGDVDCVTLGLDPTDGTTAGAYSLMALSLLGIDISFAQLGAIDPASAQLGAIQLGAIQLGAITVEDAQLGAIQLGAIDWNDPVQAQLGAIQLGAIQLGAIQLGAIDPAALTIGNTQLGAIQLGAIQLGAIQLGAIQAAIDTSFVPSGTKAGLVDYWCGSTGGLDCGDLGVDVSAGATGDELDDYSLVALGAMGAQLGAIQLGAIQLGAIGDLASAQLGAIQLGAIDIDSSQLGAILLTDTQLGAIQLGAIDYTTEPVASQLGAIQLGAIQLGAIQADGSLQSSQLGAIQLGAITNPTSVVSCGAIAGGCAANGDMTLAEIEQLGAILASATLADLAGALEGIPLQALVDDHGLVLNDLLAGVTIADLLPETTVAELPPDLTLGDIWELWAGITFFELLLALLNPADLNWEDVNPAAIAADHPSLVVGWSTIFELAGEPGLVPGAEFPFTAEAVVVLPEGVSYVPGSANLAVNPVALPVSGDPLPDPAVEGNTLTWIIDGVTLNDVLHVQYTLATSFVADTSTPVSTTVNTLGFTGSDAAPTFVFDVEPNDTFGQATEVSGDVLVLGKMGTPTDVDMFKMTVPPGGSIEAYLNPGGVDLDLVLFEPDSIDGPLRGAPERIVDGSLDPVIGIDPTEQDQESLDDIANVDLAPVFKASLHRSSANERIITPPLRNGGEYFLQITSYNQEPSDATYVSRIRVIPPPAASVCAARTSPAVTATMPAIPAGVQTMYLMHTDLFAATNSAADLAAVEAAIAAINPTDVPGAPLGVVIPVQAVPAVNTAYQAWFAASGNCSVDAANDVARAIANLVDDFRAYHPTLESIVIIGGDDQLPFFRVKDQATVANERSYYNTFTGNNPLVAALRDGFILSDSPYTDANPLYVPAGDREVFVTQMAVGRLVETPAEIVASLNQYVASGGALDTAVPSGDPDPLARVLGYDFLADSTVKIRDLLDVRYAVISNINETWTKTDLQNAMDSGAAIVNFNAHQDHTGALPAAGNIGTSDLSAVFTDLYTVDDLQGVQNSDGSVNTIYAGTLIFGMGCHGGMNAPAAYLDPSDDEYDWAQALLARRAILIANTGFGYGDTDVIAYSEELMAVFSEQIAISNTVGEAWLRAGQVFTAQTPKWSPYHDKALMEATLYGLPFYRLHDAPVTPPPIPTVPTADVNGTLRSASVTANDPLTLQPLTPTEGEFYEGDDVLALPFRPIQPLDVIGVTPNTAGLRATGAIVEALSSTDLPGFDVLFARPVLYDGLVEPEFETLGPFPNSIQAISSSETPDGRTDNLLLARGRYTPGPDGAVGTQQLFDSVQMTVYYAPDTVTDVDPPNITRVVANETALGNVVFEVDADDASGILRVVVLYKVAGANGAWTKLELTDGGTGTWTATAAVSGADLDYTVQVLGGDGLTVWSTDKAELHPVLPPAPPAIQLAGTLGNNGIYRSSVGVTIADPANAPGFPVEYSIDGGTTFTSGSSFTLPDDGTYELVARPEGFAASTSTRSVVIDKTAPGVIVTAPSNPVVVGLNGELPLRYFCTDAQSGIAKCKGTVSNGRLLDTSVPGPHEAQVTGTDKAGNTTKVLVPYEVLEVPDLVHYADVTVVAVNTPVLFTVEFGTTGGDHGIVWTFGDGNGDTQADVTASPSTTTHSYTDSGVYPVTVTVTHGDGLVQANTLRYIVVYDPSEGFVTGGGWFYSPAGAFTPSDPFDTDYMGKAEFGFNSKYKKGATVPTGNTAFEFASAGFEFHSTSYEWLVVQGDAKASYKGVGVITGREDEGSFQFMVVIRDADVNTTDAFTKDSFRIKIWKELADGTEVVEYDNGYGQDLNSETGGTTELGGGSIQIHVPKGGGKK